MFSVILPIYTLLLGIGVLLVGNGYLGTLLGVHAAQVQFGETVIGLVMSSYFVGFIAGTFLCPLLIRSAGHIRSFVAMASIASAAVLAHGLLVQPAVWALLRVVTGVCMVGLFMVIESWLNSLTPNPRRGSVLAAYMTVSLLALGIGQFLLVLDPRTILGATAVVAILYSLGLVPIALTRVIEPRPIDGPPAKIPLKSLYVTSPLGVVGVAVAGLTNGAFYGVGAVFAQGVGLSLLGIAGFMGAAIFGGVLLQWPIGHWSDQRDRRSVLAFVSFGAAVCALIAYALVDMSAAGFLASTFLFGGLLFTIYSLSVAHMNDHVGGQDVLEVTQGLLLVYGVGAIVGPVSAGGLMQLFGPKVLLVYLATALLMLTVFAFKRMRRPSEVTVEEQVEFMPLIRTTPTALEMYPPIDVETEPPAERRHGERRGAG